MGAVKQNSGEISGEVSWGDHGTSFFAFRERSDLCTDAMQRGLSLKIGDFGVKAGIGL